MPMPTLSFIGAPPAARGLLRKLGVELVERLQHAERRRDRVQRVVGIVERRVPERHDRIADIFVDRAAVREHDAATAG